MKAFVLLAGVAGLALTAGGAAAQERTVVVELFTSQGCSACPPADAMLRELAGMEGVIPLALHVDYWDYIGWQDTFGSPRYTARQQAYAMAAGERMVYTPQIIVGGRDAVIGADPMAVMAFVRAHAATATGIELALVRQGDSLQISADTDAALPQPLVVQVVRYLPEAVVDITRGENAGQNLSYANIVTDWQTIGEWDGSVPLRHDLAVAGSEPVVVILQEPGPGLIVAAAALR